MDIKIIKYGITDSTNERAREYARTGAEIPALFIANGQTNGRGRRGRSFDSAEGGGLYMSLAFVPSKSDAVLITVRAAVALARAIKKTSGLDTKIKWVNDITVGGRKLAGILAEGEAAVDGRLALCVLGIGVNLFNREFPPELADIVTTLESETGCRVEPETLANAFVSEFFDSASDRELLNEYRQRSSVIGESVEVRRISGETFIAKAVGISDSGALSVLRADGSREELISAEVSIRKRG